MSTNIFTLMPKVMADIGAIGKDRKNEKQGYKFRGIDDVYNAANSALSKNGVFSVPTVLEETRSERTNANGTLLFSVFMKIKYTFYAPDGSFIESVISSEAFDSGDKATNKALSAAQKYAFLQIFCIPTEEPKDSEIDDHVVVVEAKVRTKTNGQINGQINSQMNGHVSTAETFAEVEQPEKKPRSDWYYELRDGIVSATSPDSLSHVAEAIKAHADLLSNDEMKDLRTQYKTHNNKLVREAK